MRQLMILLCVITAFSSCTSSLSTDDYQYVGPSLFTFYDNEQNLCRNGGVSPEWLVKGTYKMFDGEIYALYVTPETEVFPYYAIWEKTRYYQTFRSESGWVKLSDIQEESPVSRIKNENVYWRHI